MNAVENPSADRTDAAGAGPVFAQGVNGSVTVDRDWVTIHKGLVARNTGIRGPRRLAVHDITAVHLEPATDGTRGSLQFALNGDRGPAANGEHTITFSEAAAEQFDQVRARVQAALDGS